MRLSCSSSGTGRETGSSFKGWPLALYAALLTLSLGLCGAAYAFFPDLRAQIVLEDAVIENLSISFYLLGVGILALGLLSRAYRFKGMVLLTVLCSLGVLEELSYGQRLFPNLEFPTLPSGMTVDALHDLSRVAVKGFEQLGVPWYLGFLFSALILLAVLAWPLRRHLPALLSAITAPHSPWSYVALATGLAATALFIDARGFVPRKWVFMEEVLEMNAAFSLAFAASIGIFFAQGARTQNESETHRAQR